MFIPRYVITHAMLRYIGQIDAIRAIVDNAPLIPSWEAKFRQDALIRAVHHGTKIEGNSLSEAQAQKIIIFDGKTVEQVVRLAGVTGRDRDIQEVINYREVLNWIDKWGIRLVKPVEYTEDILRSLHRMTVVRILPETEAGEYRTVQVAVKNSATDEVTFMPPPAIEVPYLVEDYFAWLNSDEGRLHHPVIRAAITHYELVRIHPFIDGNGRTARAMATLVLYAESYDVKRLFSLEEYFDTDASAYYRSLASVGVGESMDLTAWIEYFMIGLIRELEQVKEQISKLSRDVRFRDKIGGTQVALSERQIKLIEALNKKGQMTTADANKLLPQISPDTILRDFKDLIDKGVVDKKGRTKGAFYTLRE